MRVGRSSVSKLSRLFVAGLICMSAAGSLPASADAQDVSARFLADYGNVTVMEVTGNFDEYTPEGTTNLAPRQAVAKEFFRTHKDEYDFVVIFTDFDFRMNPATLAFYNSVKNDVRGIGKQVFNDSVQYGSNGKLQGTIDMGNLLKLVTNPLDTKFDLTVDTMVHETLHRWGAFVKFRDWNGSSSEALLGKDKSHWSFLFDSGGSTHYGNKWQSNGDGTFTSTAVRKHYSPLDLYLMGMIDRSKVPPALLIDNPAIDPAKLSEPGVIISGTARYVNIDDIIAVEGERIPNAKDSQKQFKTAFIYAVSPGTFKSDDLYGIENLRNAYLTRFSILTDGKGLVQVVSTPLENLPVNPGFRPPSSVPRTLPPNIDNGVTWLMNRQQADGSWTDFSLTTERDTAEAVTTLRHFPIAAQSFQAGFAWLGNNASANTDYLSRRIEAAVQAGSDSSALVLELLARRNRDGGWGSNRNFTSTPTDTAIALKALAVAGFSDSYVTGPAIAYLQASQNADGGWSGDDAFSTIQPTASVLTVFSSYRKNTPLETNLTKSVAFLASKQNPDGGFGNSPSTVYDTALAVTALQAAGADKTMTSRGVSYLLEQQSENGAWFDSPYQTALAVGTVWTATFDPDLSIKSEDISIIPATVTALPTNAVLSATIWNLGRNDVSQAKVTLYEGTVDPEHRLAEQTLAFPGQSPVNVTFSIPVTSSNGHVYYVVADPDSQIAESSENNNRASKSLLPEITYDFSVQAADISVVPNPVDIGKDVKIATSVFNSGTSDAYNVPLRFFIGQPGTQMEIAQLTVDIPAGGAISRELTWKANLAGVNLPLTVQIDPNNTYNEISKDNNSASVPITVNASTLPDLSVTCNDMVISPSPAREGGSASISVLVKNNGFSTAENVKVNVLRGVASNGGTLLGSKVIPSIPAGQSVRTAIEWSGIAESGERIISVQLDPDNAIQEIGKDDNFAFTSLRILGLPDVAVSSDSMSITPSAPKEGDQVVIAITVRNLGDQDAAQVDVHFKEGGTVIGRQKIPLLAGGSQVNLSMPCTPLESGAHQLTAIVDPDNLIIERDKQNNVATKAVTAQNARLWLTERYISPNGDGIKDSTQFFFRLDAPASVTIEISESQGKVVKGYSGGDLVNTSGTAVTWDGKDYNESVVKDGVYSIVAFGESRRVLARESVVVDTNHLPLSGTLAANSLLERNIACQLPLELNRNTIAWLPDESGLLVHLLATIPPIPEYPAGIYLLSPNGDAVAQVLPERWSDNTYDYVLKADSVTIAPDVKSLAFIAWMGERATRNSGYGIWLSDLSGGSRRLIHFEPEDPTIHDIEWSPDGKKILFNYGPFYRGGASHFELAYVDVEQGTKKTIVYGYPLGYSGLFSTAWSPDSTRIAFIQNLFCNSELTSCNQDKERLMVYDLNGSTSTWKTNTSGWYTLDEINWIDNGSLFYDYDRNGNIELIRDGVLIPIATDMAESQISPNGDKVAFVEYDSGNGNTVGVNLKVADANGLVTILHSVIRPELYNYEVATSIFNLLWSPDGKRITFVEGLDGSLCKYYGTSCPEAYGPNLMTVDLANGSKESSLLALPWAGYGSFGLSLLDWLDNGNIILAHDDTYGSSKPLLAIGRQSASSTQLVQGVSLPSEEGLLLSPNKNYLTYNSWGATRPVDGICRSSLWSSTSVANLTADLQAIKGRQSVTLKGIATDLNFESYTIEYAMDDAPTGWNPIVSLSTKPVINGSFSDWLPPATGTYLVRLTVRDLAGNAASKTIRVAWGTTLPLNSVLKSTDIISPNGDGVQDSVKLEYSVSEPVHLDFAISNETGAVVRTLSVDHPIPQRNFIVWDGRDERGDLVQDGMYRIAVLDYSFSVEVDSTPPQGSVTMGAIKASGSGAGYRVELTGRATDKNLFSWVVESGMGDNPQEWLPVSQGKANLIKKDDIGNPVTPESDAVIDSFDDFAIATLKGKKFRITVVDRAGNRFTSISNFVEEKAVILTWDGQSIAGAISPAIAATGKHEIAGFETLRLSATSQRLQYWTNGVWIDAGSEPPGTEGSVAYTWDSSGLQIGNAYKVRLVVVDQGGRSFASNEFSTQSIFSLDSVCPSGLFGNIAVFDEIRSLTLAVRSDQDARYREWNAYHQLDLPAGQLAFRGNLPVPETNAGMQYQIKLTINGASGKAYERQTLYPPRCPVNIELGVAYEEAQGCGQASSGRVTLSAGQKSSYGQAQFLKLDYYLLSTTGRVLLQTVDMVREGWRQTILDTAAMAEGDHQVQAVVVYYDSNDGKNKEAMATSRVMVDRVLPTARLTYPTGSETTVCPVRVPISGGNRFGIPLEGVADDAGGVKRYELFFGLGALPANWQQAFAAQASSKDPGGFMSVPINGSAAKTGQFGIWDANDFTGTNYAVRLRVIDTVGNSSCTSAGVSFDKVVQVVSLTTDKSIMSASAKSGSDLTASYRIDENANVQPSVYRLIERKDLPPILDASPIRTIGGAVPYLSGIGTAAWNGLTDDGGTAPNGHYAFVVTATDTCGNTGTKWVPVEVDSSPPVAEISYPATSLPLLPTMLVDVRGTVLDPHLSSYTLEAGEGDAPTIWRTVSAGNKEVRGTSLGAWNTYGLTGHWTLRLTASDTVGNSIQQTAGVDLGDRNSLIKSLNLAPRLFSPNGDPHLETTTISYEVTDAVFVKIEIVDAFGATIREFVRAASAGAGSITWDGRNSSGAVVADGSYSVRMTASLSTNPAVTQTETVILVVDGKPPVVEIIKPAEGACLNTTTLAVSGSVTDQNIDNYSVTMNGPTGIIAQEQGTQNRQNNTFLTFADLAEDTYTLTVDAQDLGQNQTKYVRTFTIDRTPPKSTLDTPKGGEFYGNSKNVIDINGAIVEKNLERYALRYGFGDAPTEWKEVVGGDTIPSVSKLSSLKVGKTDGIADGVYMISLFAKDKAGLEGEAKARIVVDNTVPDVSVTYPKDGDYLTKPTDIKGTAADSYLDKGTLELAEGQCVSAIKWAVMKTFNSSARDGILDSWKTLPADGEYCLRFTASDKTGNKSEAKVGFKVDTHSPAAPKLAGKTENKTTNGLNWTKSPDPDVAGYNLYRSGQKLNAAPIADLAYSDAGLVEGGYAYSVKAVDIAGNESDASNSVTLNVDLSGPSVRISSPVDGAKVSSLVDIKGTAYSSDDFKEYSVFAGQGISPSTWTPIRRSPLPISFGTLAQWDSITHQDGAQITIKLVGEDMAGNISSAQTTVIVDNTPPQTPVLLAATPDGVNATLYWKANIEPDLSGYLLYRNDQLANMSGIVAGNLKPYLVTGTGYTDKSLVDGTYQYYLVAMDQTGNSSGQSNTLAVTIDIRPPHMTILEPQSNLKFESKIEIKADTPDNDIATVQFQYKRLQDTTWVNLSAPLAKPPFSNYFDPRSLSLAYGNYQLQALAVDKAGKHDSNPPVVAISYIDLTPPEIPVSLAAKVNGADVTLTWSANAETDLDGYNIYRWSKGAKTRLNSAVVKTLGYLDAEVPDGINSYEITAIDVFGNESKSSEQKSARIYAPLITQPYTPVKIPSLVLEGSGVEPGSSVEISLSVPAGAATKTSVIAGPAGSFKLEGMQLSLGENRFTAIASDPAGNISRKTDTVVVVYDEPPAAPTGLAASVSGYEVSLTWNGNSETDIIGYNLFRDGEKVNSAVAVTGGQASASYQDYYSRPQFAIDGTYGTYWGTSYGSGMFTPAWWQMSLPGHELISRVEIDWQLGDWDYANSRYNIMAGKDYEIQAWSGYNWVTLKKIVGNDQQYNTIDISPSYRTDRIRIAITSTTDPNYSKYVRINEIRFRKDNLLLSNNYTDPGLLDHRYSYEVTAVGRHGIESGPSMPVTAVVGDVEPPGPPTSLAVTAQGSDAVLAWSPPEEAVSDLAEYYVYRETPVEWIFVGITSLSARTYMVQNLVNGTYRYRVTARDFTGNESTPSNEVEATVRIEPPSPPTMLIVSAPPNGGALDIYWQMPAGAGKHSFHVYRSLSEAGPFSRVSLSAVSGNRFHDNRLVNGTTYFYRVKALDDIGNESGPSNTAAGVPQDIVTMQPMILKPTVPGTPYVVKDNWVTVGGIAEPAAQVDVIKDGSLIVSASALTQQRQTDMAMVMDTNDVSMSPDGRILASNRNSQGLALLDMQSNVTTNVYSGLTYIWGAPHWSPSGRYLLIDGYDYDWQQRMALYDREAGSMQIISTGDTKNEYSPSWSAKEDTYVFAGTNPNGQKSIWLAKPGDNSVIRIADVEYADLPRLSPDETRIAYFDSVSLSVFDRTNGATAIVDDNNDQWSSAWSPDGSQLAFISYRDGEGDVYSYNVADGSVARRTTTEQDGYRVVWSPDGSHLGYVSYPGGDELFSIVDANGVEMVIFTASDEMYGIPEWRSSGELLIFDQFGLHTVQPPGYFTAQVDKLVPGENRIVAVSTDSSGNRSTPSEPITVVLDTGAMPDLAIADSDITFFPPVAKPGEEVLVTVRVRNTSNNPTSNVTTDLYLWDGSGDVTLIKSESILRIDANGEGTVSARFNVGSTIGTLAVIAVVDPSELINEVQENNNYAARNIVVTNQEKVQLTATINALQCTSNQDLVAEVSLLNSGRPKTGFLTVTVEDADGNIIKQLIGQTMDMPYGSNESMSFSWNTEITYSGSYRFHAVLKDGSEVLAEDFKAFAILPDLKVSAGIVTDRLRYNPRQDVGMTVAFKNSGANYIIPQLRARVRILDQQNNESFSGEQTIANLMPDSTGSLSYTWGSGLSSPGAYTAKVDIYAGDRLVASGNAAFNIMPSVSIGGSIKPDPSVVFIGGSIISIYNLNNNGNADTNGTAVVSLIDPVTRAVIASYEEAVTIPLGGNISGTVGFPTAGLTLQNYLIHLHYLSQLTSVSIASASVLVKDGLPPVVTVASPQEGADYTTGIALSVFASDDASGVDRVEYSIDNGAWKLLPLVDPSRGRYSATWTPNLSDNGAHSVSFRGSDRAGNPSQPVSVNFVVQNDTIPPLLIVSTLVDGSYTNNEVLNISGAVTDNVGVKELQINGVLVPFGSDAKFSQVMLLKAGENRVEVKVTDLANNTVQDNRTIYLDQKAPLLVIDTPADNSKTGTGLINVSGSVDETSTVEVTLDGVIQSVIKTGNNFQSTAALIPGAKPNTIGVTAIDIANNPSSEKRTVYYDDQSPSLAITEPGQDIRTNQRTLTISGTASDSYGFPVIVDVDMIGQKFSPQVIDGKFELVVNFTTENTYRIVVTATNEFGHNSSVTRNIIFDTTPPPLSIDPVISPTVLSSQTIGGSRENGVDVNVTCAAATLGVVEYPTDTTWRVALSGMKDGDNVITVQAYDAAGNRSVSYSNIKLLTVGSDVTFTLSPNIIWPPNHKMVSVSIGGELNIPEGDVQSVDITFTDEYGKYNYTDLKFGSTVQVEAWRDGTDKNGRSYLVTVVVTRRDGSRTEATATVLVPHDIGK